MTPGFRSTMTVPPGGLWFWEDRDHWVASPSYDDVERMVRAILRKKGDPTPPSVAIAEYMCPRMPPGFCMSFSGAREDTAADFLRRAVDYSEMPLADAMTVASRLETCAKCSGCRFDSCLHCRGIDEKVRLLFGGRRAIIPQDRGSGICTAAGTYTMAVASVRYPDGAVPWEGTPRTCWRFCK